MRLLVISLGRLITNGSAGNAVMCGLVQSALARGWDVNYLALVPHGGTDNSEIPFQFGPEAERLKQADLHYRPESVGRIKRFLSGFNQASATSVVALDECRWLTAPYDAVVAFDSLAVSLLPHASARRKLAILGDPAGDRLWFSSNWRKPMLKLKALALGWAEVAFFRRLDAHIALAMFGTSHASAWARRLRRPVIDLRPFMTEPHIEGEDVSKHKPIVYFGGTLAGTASRKSMHIISAGILPALRRRFGQDGFELRLVGDCPAAFREAVDRFREVRILGRVNRFEEELAKGDIFILPMNYPVGVRTRICSALAAGNVCIAHPSVLQNMPELEACGSVMFAIEPQEYAERIQQISEGRELQAMKMASRAFFRSHYIASVAAAPLLDYLEAN